jgi:transcriptional regulator of arginine metabolism
MHLCNDYASYVHKEAMQKETRQKKILSLIRSKRIGKQDELAAHLERAGVVATQSSVSRDLVELGVVKQRGFYTLPQSPSGAAAHGLLSLEPAGDSLIVAKCEPGMASALAVEIDRAGIIELIGTLAGDDTIFIAVGERKSQRSAMKRILDIFS